MSMYNLIEYSDIFSKILGNLWHRDKPCLERTNNINFIDDNNNNNSISFKFKEKVTGKTGNE